MSFDGLIFLLIWRAPNRSIFRSTEPWSPSAWVANCFATLAEAKQTIGGWPREYNKSRPDGAFSGKTPNETASESAPGRELTPT